MQLFGVNFEHYITAGFIQIQIHSYKKIENKISFDFQTMSSCVSNFLCLTIDIIQLLNLRCLYVLGDFKYI